MNCAARRSRMRSWQRSWRRCRLRDDHSTKIVLAARDATTASRSGREMALAPHPSVMSSSQEFHYRLPRRHGGWRPGSHPASSLGAGQEFVSHVRLYDRPDPRRLDVRASVRDVRGDWLVRAYRQRAAVSVHALVDVSASMAFGSMKPKLHVVADFMEVLGRSAFRVGDALGMLAFDSQERTDLFMPARLSRGAGEAIATLLRSCTPTRSGVEGLDSAAA